jgi:hypothetical protein
MRHRAALLCACCRPISGAARGVRAGRPAPRCIRQHTSAYVSIRENTSAYVSRRRDLLLVERDLLEQRVENHRHRQAGVRHLCMRQHTSAYVSIRQHRESQAPTGRRAAPVTVFRRSMSAYVSVRQRMTSRRAAPVTMFRRSAAGRSPAAPAARRSRPAATQRTLGGSARAS